MRNSIDQLNLAPTDSEREIASKLGLVPNFFRVGKDATGIIDELWTFARAAYIDNPMPALFKERLFVHLSRFCEVRYCIVRHVGFLLGKGNPAGDSSVRPQSVQEVLDLLRRPGLPESEALDQTLIRLRGSSLKEMPGPGTQAEADVFVASSILFLQPDRAATVREALRTALGVMGLELLTAFLAFVRTAHYWTVTHPDLSIETDMEEVLAQQHALASCLLDDPEAGRGDLSRRLFDELIQLRQERDDRVALRKALADLEESTRQQQILIDELNHRVRNTLSIVHAITMQTLRGTGVAENVGNLLVERLMALSRAHDMLTRSKWQEADLNEVVENAVACFSQTKAPRIQLKGPVVKLTPKQALSLSLAMHELATNALKHGALSNDQGSVQVAWDIIDKCGRSWLSLKWAESGGPKVEPPTRLGFGRRFIERGLAADLGGQVRPAFQETGLVCTIDAPLLHSEYYP